jgi:hypothetical protein
MEKKRDTNKEYHSSESISASGLKIIYKQSVYHYLNQKPFSSKSMNFGNAVHSAILENDLEDIVVMKKLDLRSNENKIIQKEFLKDNKDKIILNEEEFEGLEKIIENVSKNKRAKNLLKELDEVEHSYYGEIDDVEVRIRPDGVKYNSHILDLKTTSDVSPMAFKRQIYNLSYHLQACFYSESLGYSCKNFRFLVIGNKDPYDVEIYSMGETMIESGKMAWRSAFDQWKNYLKTGKSKGFIWDNINQDGSLIL